MKEDDRRLIEDYLPIDVLNAIAAKEKKHPRHPVALIHYWPARRPTTACRAAIYSALVPAPASQAEREAAARFVERLAAFKLDPKILAEATRHILEANGGHPKVLDLFAGGGAIPLEAARLGCDAYAIEYNPLAYIIELCTVVYPQTFGPSLASDVDRVGKSVLARVKSVVNELFPTITTDPTDQQLGTQLTLLAEGTTNTQGTREPVSYIWARTVPCRRPGCDAVVPLVRQAWLRKDGTVVASVPRYNARRGILEWEIQAAGTARELGVRDDSQTGAGEAACLACSTPATADHVRQCGLSGTLQEVLAAVVCQGSRSKVYLHPSTTQIPDMDDLRVKAERVLSEIGLTLPAEPFQGQFQNLPNYGFTRYRDLFNGRQLFVLAVLIREIRRAKDVLFADSSIPKDRAIAIVTYLSMTFGRFVNSYMRFCRWQGQDQKTIAAIGDRQSMKMVYDFSEINPFAETAGALPFALQNEVESIKELSKVKRAVTVTRGSADKLPFPDAEFDAVVTDPPYYGSIFYSDASAIFYVWHRRILGDLYPEHFALELPPKRREAVAQPEQHGGDPQKANEFYETMMASAFAEARRVLRPGGPFVCVYAHKTTEGWVTLINALVRAGIVVTEAWPVQTEARGRVRALGSAALSDSIFFVARRRESAATGSYETDVRPELERIARERVATLWAGGKGIGGADLLMAAVGAGLKPFTQFARVEYANGDEVSATRYLRDVEGVVLDTMLEQVFGLSKAGVSAVDRLTRFYVLWRFTYRESAIEAGDAFVFCYPQGIEIDGPDGISGPAPALVEKSRSTYRVRTFEERGDDDSLGVPDNGVATPLIDVLHRVLWLVENAPARLAAFLRDAKPNLEELRLIAQALCGPVLKGTDVVDAALTPELSTLSKLTANWRSVIEGAALSQEIDERRAGQTRLPLDR